METIIETISDYFTWLTLPAFKLTDVLEILILAFIIYNIIKWIKYTRAWTLFKGLLVLLVFSMFAAIMQFDVILWIIRNTLSVGIIALVIIFQPELRRALEDLGRRNLFPKFISLSESDDNNRFSDRTIEELIKASFELAKSRHELAQVGFNELKSRCDSAKSDLDRLYEQLKQVQSAIIHKLEEVKSDQNSKNAT